MGRRSLFELCERSVPGPWLRYTRFAESVAVVPTWRGKEGRGVRRRRVRRKDVACGFDSGGGPHLLDHDAFGEAVVEQVAAELDVRGRRRPHAGVRVVVHL